MGKIIPPTRSSDEWGVYSSIGLSIGRYLAFLYSVQSAASNCDQLGKTVSNTILLNSTYLGLRHQSLGEGYRHCLLSELHLKLP